MDDEAPLIRIKQLLLGVCALLGVLAIIGSPYAALRASVGADPQEVIGLVAGAALLGILLRPLTDWLVELLRIFRPVESTLLFYVVLILMFIFSTLSHRRVNAQMIDDLTWLAQSLLVAQVWLLLLGGTDRGFGMALINALLLLMVAVIADASASGFVVIYMALATAAIVVHTHQLAGREAPVDPHQHLLISLRRAVGGALLVLVLLLPLLPLLPELSFQLTLQPIRVNPDTTLPERVMRALVMVGVMLVGLKLIERFLDFKRRRRGNRRAEDELEDLLVEPQILQTVPPRRSGRGQTADERVVDHYCDMVARLAGYGWIRPGSQTAREYRTRIDRAQPQLAEPLGELTELFCTARYAESAALGDADVERARALAAEIARDVRPPTREELSAP